MTVPLKPSWKSKVLAIKLRIYPLDNKTRYVVHNIFDKIYKHGHLEYTIDPTLFSFLVFVIYKTELHKKRKSQIIVDIRKLNNLVLLEFYPLPL